MTNHTITWKRDGHGRQISKCGNWAVQSDGYEYISEALREGSGPECGITGGEWALIPMTEAAAKECGQPVDHNYDWYSKMYEAKAAAERFPIS